MQHHTTTAELKAFSTGNQINRLILQVFDGLPHNKHRINPNGARVIGRDEAERLTIAVDLNNLGLTPRAIKAVVHHPDAKYLHTAKKRLMVLRKSGDLDFCNSPDEEPIDDSPLVIIDLRSIKARVDAAIEFAAVRRWGMDREFFKALPKSQSEIKAAMDNFIARRKAGEFV